jgi:hypothetical protein
MMRRLRSALHARPALDFALKVTGLSLVVAVCVALDHALAVGSAVAAPF